MKPRYAWFAAGCALAVAAVLISTYRFYSVHRFAEAVTPPPSASDLREFAKLIARTPGASLPGRDTAAAIQSRGAATLLPPRDVFWQIPATEPAFSRFASWFEQY